MTNLGKTAAAVAVAASVMLAGSAASAATFTYNVNETIGGGSVTGSLTTDGATGVLGASDFVAWDLILNGLLSATYHVDQTNSSIVLNGVDAAADASHIYFNFSGADNGMLLFQQNLFSGTHYWCNATSSNACFQGSTVTPQHIFDGTAVTVAREGTQIIASAVATGAPEPAIWGLMLAGFGGLGAMLRRRRRALTA